MTTTTTTAAAAAAAAAKLQDDMNSIPLADDDPQGEQQLSFSL